jgi:putative glutamine amidotransferase
MSERPVIGVSGPDRGGFPAWLFVSWVVRAAGGHPVRITPSRGVPPRTLDALIIGGGADIDPHHYGAGGERVERRKIKRAKRPGQLIAYLLLPIVFLLRILFGVRHARVDKARDALELALLERAELEGRPVLGICRGAQLLNIHAGGSLHRELDSFYVESANPETVFPRKLVRVMPNSRLHELLELERCRVNSLHRQAVRELGRNLSVAAVEHSGVIQAIERSDRPFWVGVQWHPEYLPYRVEQRRLFEELVLAAKQRNIEIAAIEGNANEQVEHGQHGVREEPRPRHRHVQP